eukprot:TRINITY_DN11021_c0_g1_i2.p1 TRINITY_DN11021_c0_g1~~TRINITY_DN11021_c0_g1_i2.p1  ORF type:complete len:123 (-),score=23.36 TRINITY_DN11021_c0_g1_i2:271-591(-)
MCIRDRTNRPAIGQYDVNYDGVKKSLPRIVIGRETERSRVTASAAPEKHVDILEAIRQSEKAQSQNINSTNLKKLDFIKRFRPSEHISQTFKIGLGLLMLFFSLMG